jgi:hypothetical protein
MRGMPSSDGDALADRGRSRPADADRCRPADSERCGCAAAAAAAAGDPERTSSASRMAARAARRCRSVSSPNADAVGVKVRVGWVCVVEGGGEEYRRRVSPRKSESSVDCG